MDHTHSSTHVAARTSCPACSQSKALYRVCVIPDGGTESRTDITFHGPSAERPVAEGMRLVLAAEALERAYGVLYDFVADEDEGAAIVTVIRGVALYVVCVLESECDPEQWPAYAPLWSTARGAQ